jgi:type IV secretion system protein VirD4
VLANDARVRVTSKGYNPMRWLNPASDDFVDDATAIAEAIVPVRSQREPHWEESAQDLIAGLIMYHRLVKPPGTSLAAIRDELSRTEDEWRDLIVGNEEGYTEADEPSVTLAADTYKCPELERKLSHLADLTPENRELLGVISSARTNTRFLGSPPIARDLALEGVDFAEMRTKPMTVYLVLPPVRLVTHAKWLRLVISGAIEALRKTTPQRDRPDVLFMLDEFPQLGHMQNVETGVQLNAGYGIKFWIVVQNVTQLKQHYRDNWETFFSAGAITAYAPRDPTTSQELAKLSGERTIEVPSYGSTTDGKQSYSINFQRRENIMPHEFRRMRKGQMFVRVPSDTSGESLYITHAPDFTELPDIPAEIKELGRAAA